MSDFIQFTIVEKLDGGCPRHIQEHGMYRLSCLTDQEKKLVVWGSEGGDPGNINTIVALEPPFCIECAVLEPTLEAMAKYGDVYWVDEATPISIIEH